VTVRTLLKKLTNLSDEEIQNRSVVYPLSRLYCETGEATNEYSLVRGVEVTKVQPVDEADLVDVNERRIRRGSVLFTA
jgi:hypothetical protein